MILACCASVLSHVTSYTSQPAPTTAEEDNVGNTHCATTSNDGNQDSELAFPVEEEMIWSATTFPRQKGNTSTSTKTMYESNVEEKNPQSTTTSNLEPFMRLEEEEFGDFKSERPTLVKRSYEEDESDSPFAKRLRTEEEEKTSIRCVHFSTVQILSFGVELGECTIPGDTGFPLGMEQEHFREEWFDLSTIKVEAKSHENRADPKDTEDIEDIEDDTEDDMSNDGQEGTEKTKSKKKKKKKRIGLRSVAKEIRLDRLEDAGVTYDEMTVYGNEAYPILVSRLTEVAKQKREKRRKKQRQETLRRMEENGPFPPPTKRPAQEDQVESTAKRHKP
ncbi:unnamed protein product [Aphanomyces euteiches]